MRNIVIVSHKFPPVNSGYGNQALAVLKKIAASSIEFSFLVLTAKYEVKLTNLNSDKIKIRYFWHRLIPVNNEQINFLNYAIFQLQVFFWLLFNYPKYDIIHCLASGPHYALAVIAGKLLKKKVIVKITNERFFKINEFFFSDNKLIYEECRQENKKSLIFQNEFFKRQIRSIMCTINSNLAKIVLTSDVLIGINNTIVDQLIKHHVSPKRIIKIPNGVDETIYFPVKTKKEKDFIRSKLDLELKSLVIIFAGNISYIKGVQDLVKAVSIINDKNNIMLVICGEEGDYGQELSKTLAEAKNLHSLKAIYRGNVDNLFDYYRAADIFALPSYIEGLPNVLLEAAMSGLPLVASDIGGNKDVIEEVPCGLLFPPGDVERLRQALLKLIDNHELRISMGNNARQTALKNFCLPSIAKKYTELYQQL